MAIFKNLPLTPPLKKGGELPNYSRIFIPLSSKGNASRSCGTKEILFFLFFFLLSTKSVFAASFKISPASGTFNQGCTSSVNVTLDTEGGVTNAADIIIDYDPTQIQIVDSDPNQSGTQIIPGTVFPNYFGNTVDTSAGVIRLTGANFTDTFNGSGVFATIQFKPVNNNGNGNLNIRFTGADPYNSLDSNIADANTSNDMLSSVQNGFFAFTSGSCINDKTPPAISFISPVNKQQNVPSDASITVQISDSESGVDINTVKIIINGVTYLASDPRVTVTGTAASYTFTVKPYDPLYTSQTDTVLVQASDLSANSQQGSISFNIPGGSPTSTPAPTATPTSGPSPTPTPHTTPVPYPTCPVCAITCNGTTPVYPSPTINPSLSPTFGPSPTVNPNAPTPTVNPEIIAGDHHSPDIDFINPVARDTIGLKPNIIFKVSDSESGVSSHSVKITLNNRTYTIDDPQLSFTGSANAFTFTLKPDQSLTAATEYTITVFGADLAGNGLSQSIIVTTSTPFINQIENVFRYNNTTKHGPSVSPLVFLSIFGVILLFFLIYSLINLLRRLGILDVSPLGVVFNSATREPIAGVTVDIFNDTNTKIASPQTNVFGIFAAKLVPGKYKFVARHRDYVFPSALSKSKLNYPHPYTGQTLTVKSKYDTYVDIPLDPNFSSASAAGKILQLIGFALPPPGTVTDKTNKPVSGLTLGLKETKFDSLVATRVTDTAGHYRFLVPPGRYQLVIIDKADAPLLIVDTRHQISGYTVINEDIKI